MSFFFLILEIRELVRMLLHLGTKGGTHSTSLLLKAVQMLGTVKYGGIQVVHGSLCLLAEGLMLNAAQEEQ